MLTEDHVFVFCKWLVDRFYAVTLILL